MLSESVLDRDHDEYVVVVVRKQFCYFGQFPTKITEIADLETAQSILLLIEEILPEKMTPFARTTEREVVERDRELVGGS
jgi:hypothetical protein